MTVLNDLSTEIFLQIFSLLPSLDLAQACRVCQRWYAMAEKPLFTSVSLDGGASIELSLKMFFRTIRRRPALATHLKDLTVSWEFSDIPGRVYAEMLLLERYLTSLRTLYIYPPARALAREFPAGPPGGGGGALFQSLREFTWDRLGGWGSGIGPMQLLIVMTLPCIRQITVDMSEAPGMDSIDPALLAPHIGNSTVTHLTLRAGNMTGAALTRVLQLPRALTHLTYADEFAHVGNADIGDFRLALGCVRETLQYLRLGECSAFKDEDPRNAYRGVGSLKDWPALRSVGGAFLTLIGLCEGVEVTLAGVMPAGLREVVVMFDRGGWEEESVRNQIEMMVGGEGALH